MATCAACGKEVEKIKTQVVTTWDAVFVGNELQETWIDSVVKWVCPLCDKDFFSAKAHKLEELKTAEDSARAFLKGK